MRQKKYPKEGIRPYDYCSHVEGPLVIKGPWEMTFVGVDHVNEVRRLVFACKHCNKVLDRRQFKRDGKIINFKDIT